MENQLLISWFSSLIDSLGSLGCQDKARVETFMSLVKRFDENPEELNEIGIFMRHFLKTCLDFKVKFESQTTTEGLKSVLEEMEKRVWNTTFTLDDLVTALDKYILEKGILKFPDNGITVKEIDTPAS